MNNLLDLIAEAFIMSLNDGNQMFLVNYWVGVNPSSINRLCEAVTH